MRYKSFRLSRFLKWSAKKAGDPLAFVSAWIFIILWTAFGLLIGFSDTWILILNTLATINASLMVFIIQHTQNREMQALHLKLDELIRNTEKTQKELIAIEEREEADLDLLRKQLLKRDKTEKS